MDDLLRDFLTETNENISLLDSELVKLERNPDDPQLLGNIFRLVHTVKGTCGFLGLPRLETLAHASETVLGKIRDGELAVTPVAVTLILESLDGIKSILATLEAAGAEPAGSDANLIDRLNELASGEPPGTRAAGALEGDEVEPAPLRESAVAAQSIRIDVDLLENLMTMVSELVLTRNQLLQIQRGQKGNEFGASLQRLSHVTSELQESVMKTRMQPIGNAWAKLPRIVRDLGHELGKKIDFRMYGADIELDRQVLEMIKDPLTHMVRNSADHGIERPAERLTKGKPETGVIMLAAFHEGGRIVIEISDDGRGLDTAAIKAKALSSGLATEAQLAAMSEQQINRFILKPGFSTASEVTSVSGRGVGMDVVYTNIETIGGTVEVKSRPGEGSSFTFKMPLTLAIVPALLVECAGERFAIPQVGVLELVRAAVSTEHRVERVNGTPVLRLRERLLPLVSLRSLLGLGPPGVDCETYIVVTQVGASTFGIMVDRVLDTEDIVVKPVAPILRDIAVFAGTTILGDGSVIMILDPSGVAASMGAITAGGPAHVDVTAPAALREERTPLLLFQAGDGGQKAVPLALVARLEEIEATAIECSNGKPVVQYRGKLMPLVSIDPSCRMRSDGRQPILVFAEDDRTVGLAVDEIVDIVEDRLLVELGGGRPGLIGSAIVAGKATDIIDAAFYLTQGFREGSGAETGLELKSKRVRLVEDSPGFRTLSQTPIRARGAA